MKESREILYLATLILLLALIIILKNQLSDLKQAVRTYEERQLALISQDKAIREELADLKRYIETGEASGG